MAKWESAHYEQFLLLPQCFQNKIQNAETSKNICGKGLKEKEKLILMRDEDKTDMIIRNKRAMRPWNRSPENGLFLKT